MISDDTQNFISDLCYDLFNADWLQSEPREIWNFVELWKLFKHSLHNFFPITNNCYTKCFPFQL